MIARRIVERLDVMGGDILHLAPVLNATPKGMVGNQLTARQKTSGQRARPIDVNPFQNGGSFKTKAVSCDERIFHDGLCNWTNEVLRNRSSIDGGAHGLVGIAASRFGLVVGKRF